MKFKMSKESDVTLSSMTNAIFLIAYLALVNMRTSKVRTKISGPTLFPFYFATSVGP